MSYVTVKVEDLLPVAQKALDQANQHIESKKNAFVQKMMGQRKFFFAPGFYTKEEAEASWDAPRGDSFPFSMDARMSVRWTTMHAQDIIALCNASGDGFVHINAEHAGFFNRYK